jgi:hypothetical protein
LVSSKTVITADEQPHRLVDHPNVKTGFPDRRACRTEGLAQLRPRSLGCNQLHLDVFVAAHQHRQGLAPLRERHHVTAGGDLLHESAQRPASVIGSYEPLHLELPGQP